MTDNQDQLNKLLIKLEALLKRQEAFSKEVHELREEIYHLKSAQSKKTGQKETPIETVSVKTEPTHHQSESPKKLTRNDKNYVLGGVCSGLAEYFNINVLVVRILWILLSVLFCVGVLLYFLLWIALPSKKSKQAYPKMSKKIKDPTPVYQSHVEVPREKSNRNLEKFIGENLINKIGIVILVIGVGIGAKYSIEHDLISPLTRIILGYLIGLGLLVFGIKLKEKYVNFSAVLVSGAMTVLYVMTYLAYGLYGLLPQVFAFCLMVLFTVFTVISALNYNKQIIAHIGLVGAYAVPFLLSENSGNATVLFSYMVIINSGILVIAFKKYWKALYISSFLLTWLIYATWHASSYSTDVYFAMALVFILLFFAVFYATFLAFKLIQQEKFEVIDIVLLLANSFIFYGFGYAILDNHETGTKLLGLFTLGNGLLHFIVSVIIYKQKLGDRNLFYLVSGLVLVFVTITFPVQLDGNWVTLLWIGEAALLFWIGRTKSMAVYEYISYPLMALATLSILQDWTLAYSNYLNPTETTPLFNPQFLTSVFFIGGFYFIYVLNTQNKYKSFVKPQLLEITSFVIPAVLISAIYLAFRLELENYWQVLYNNSRSPINDSVQNSNLDLLKFKTIWVLNYSLLFVSVLSFLNMKKIKNRVLGQINVILNVFAIIVFLTQGLYTISQLRESYLEQNVSSQYNIGDYHIMIRYLSLAFLAWALYACYKYIRKEFMTVDFKMGFDILLYTTLVWIASSELIHWLDMANSTESYKLGLSILWGVYSLILISLGIWKTKTHLRIGAIILFSITLIKLFFYDISHLNTISKTIVFVSLGILLLIISFLYNKFKHKITSENDY
ncbi:DUF2339 domain-containing protein [Aestuariivivens sediminis]|uniref:DUF2339 domain-containing protein n=1 Tax=Aestuariivivens sediminis TaxID=2913557 RepID=UPI001F59B1D8|nr:DUF2339 domain-containing protein [Aestuariivivens sediminis]